MTSPTTSRWGRKLDGMNATTWRASIAGPQMRSSMTGLFLLDRVPDVEALEARMERVTREFPVLRSRIIDPVGPFGQPRLVVDPDFDLAFHTTHYTLPGPGSWEQLLQHARRHSMTDLDRDRALWRATLIDGIEGGRAAVVLVVHHAIADGQGLMMMVSGLLDASPEHVVLERVEAPAPGRVDRGTVTATALGSAMARGARTAAAAAYAVPRAAVALASNPWGAVSGGLRFAASARRVGQVHRAPLSSLLTGRASTYTPRTLDVTFDSMRKVAKEYDGSMNDAFLAALAAGFRRYHDAHDALPGSIRVNVPVSFRSTEARADQIATAVARIELDTRHTTTETSFGEIQHAMAAAIREPFLPRTDLLADLTRVAPAEVLVALSRGSDLTASNVPGLPDEAWMGGAKVERMYPLVATLGAAANITLLSYARQWCSIGIDVDDAAIPDPELFVRCLADGFAEHGMVLAHHPHDPTDTDTDTKE